MNIPDILKGMSPDARAAFHTELTKALTGEHGYIGAAGQRIAKDATNNVGVTTGLGLLGVPLEVPAKLLYPVPTPLRNRLPRRVTGGDSVTFRKITGINTTKLWASVAQASDTVSGRNSRIAFNEANVTYNFKSLEDESLITPEALMGANSQITPGQDFQAGEFATLSLLQALMLMEEDMLLGGNITALGDVANLTKTGVTQAATTVGSLTASTAYYFGVAAITQQGYRQSVAGQVAAVDQQGEGRVNALTSISTTAGGNAGDESITLTWDAIEGAVAYNVYISATNSVAAALYYATVYTNKAQVDSVPVSGNRPNATDKTANALDYDGLLPHCTKTALGRGYFRALGGATGATLTGDGTANCAEFDTAFKYFWDNFKTGPDEIWVNSTQYQKYAQIVAGSTAPVLRIDATAGDLNISGGIGIGDSMNRYMGKKTPVSIHPTLAPGNVLFVSYQMGAYYPNANINQNAEVVLGWDYRKIDFGLVKRAQEIGIDCRGALVVRAPFAMGGLACVA